MVLAWGAYSLSQQQATSSSCRRSRHLDPMTVIATDKTGTLTRNQMVVDRFLPGTLERKMLEVGALCNDAIRPSKLVANNPPEAVLLFG